MPVGRPLKFKTNEELQSKIDEYFNLCDSKTKKIKVKDEIHEIPDPRPYTITGLALHLDTNRQTLINYEKKEEYFDTITRAKVKIESFTEESLWQPKIASGIIFNLKNNYGWVDKTETDITSKGEKLEVGGKTAEIANKYEEELKKEL